MPMYRFYSSFDRLTGRILPGFSVAWLLNSLQTFSLSRNRHRQLYLLKCLSVCAGLLMLVLTDVSAQAFAQSDLNFNNNGGVNSGTSLMYGPDGRLYVLSLNGTIDVFTVQKNGPNNYIVTTAEELLDVKLIPNHNDDGSANTGNNREATGLTVAGTAANPIIYVTSSDSRVGGPSGDQNLDTNSGVITRLTWNGTSWEVVDIVRGLPRSEENHATNGLEFVTINGTDFLIVSQGGHANAGAPSDNFAWTTEYALSAAVLSVNLTMLEAMPILNDGREYIYDIPTLDDPTRANVGPTDPDAAGYTGIDVGDPWGGNDGLNQAMVVIGGPVQIFSPGYRNTYDLTVTQNGKVYVTDNGANGGWGGLPENEGELDAFGNSLVTNNYPGPSEPGSSSPVGGEQVNNQDHLTLVTTDIQNYAFGSFYGGHPTPIRANTGGVPGNLSGAGLYTNPSVNSTTGAIFRTLIYDPDGSRGAGYTTDPNLGLPANWPPVPPSLADPREGDWRGPGINNPDGDNDVIVTNWQNNTNGIDEYTSTVFTGSESMVGNLIAGKNGGSLHRVQVDPVTGGLQTLSQNWISGLGGNALGITCNSDTDPFPGTIWVATFNGTIKVLEPQPAVVCYPFGDPLYVGSADTDLDGYSNQDEVDNGVDHCNGGSQPNDFDKSAGGTLVSDLNDTDDDNDGISDALDPFQLGDPTDAGSDAFDLPVLNELLSDNPTLKGYLGLGFTGMMNNGAANPNWLNWLDVVGGGPNPNDILGGAVGAMTMQMTAGTALGTTNTQEKAFQYGVNVDQSDGNFSVEGRLFNFGDPLQLYGASAPANGELGIYIGDGTQSNYIKAVITQNGLVALQEVGDVAQTPITLPIATPNRPSNDIVFIFNVDPATGDVQIQYVIDGGAVSTLGNITAQGAILTAIQQTNTPLAVGLIGSSNTTNQEVEGTWDYLNVVGNKPSIAQVLPNIDKLINAAADNISLDNYFDDDDGVANLIYTLEANTDPAIGASITANTLTLTYPAVAASSTITVRATDGGGLFVEQTFTVNVTEQPAVLFRVNAGDVLVAATDGPNPDWAANGTAGAQTGTGFSVNTGNISTHNITGRHSSVPAYAPQALFAKERWDPPAQPEMEWQFATGNGTFTVNLYMGNGFAGTSTPGTRVFDVNMEGALVIDDKDLAAQYGTQVGAMESYQVTVTDGTLNIEFIHQTENPLINAIEILGAGSVVNPPVAIDPVANQVNNLGETPILNITANGGDPNENLAFSATGLPPGLSIEPTQGAILGTLSALSADAGLYNVAVTVSKPSSTPVVANFTWTVIDPNAPNTVVYRINTGGALAASTDASPINWEADQSAVDANGNAVVGTPSPYVNSAAEDITFGAALPGAFVNNTSYPNSLFTTERYNTNPVPDNMQWDFPVANGTYTVNLIFAEIWTGAQTAGVRVFDVEIEGQLELNDFDQTATYGWATAGVESFTVNVTDGNLDIDFIQGVQNPNIKAIEIISSSPPPVSGQWVNITNVSEHTPRHENSFVQAGDKFYLFGGRESADKVDVYDYQTDTWTQTASTAPFEFNHFQPVEYQGLIWVIGAFKANDGPNPGLDEPPADNIFMYDPATDTWIEGPAVPAGRKRGSAGLVMYNNKFYVIAGNTIGHSGGYIPWFDEFDPATGIWTSLADAPHARDHFHATIVGDKLYVVGGRLSGGPGGTFAPLVPEVDVYDFNTSSWSTLPVASNLPNARAAAATVTFQGDVVVIGGEGGGQAYTNTDALDVATGTWTALDPLNNARHGTQGIVSGDGIWITSGSPNQGGGNQTNMEVFGTDNPTGTALIASTLTTPASVIVPIAGNQSFTIDNSGGNQGIYVSALSLSGTNNVNFNILGSPTENFLIPAGASKTIQVEHTGTVAGEVASLDIAYGSASTTSISLTSGQVAPTVLFRVNTGGALVVAADAPNPDWTEDTDNFTSAGNSQYLTTMSTGTSIYAQTSGSAYQGPIVMTDPSLPAGTPSSIFQTERYDGAPAPEMLWQFPIDPGTQVEVRLYFAELFNGIAAAGERVFDVSIEGVIPPALDGIDPFATAGALGAFMRSHTLTVTDGTLDIEFIHDVENPSIKAIEILGVVATPNAAPVVTNPGIQSGVDGDVVSLQVVASDPDDCGGLTFSATGLPPTLAIDPATGLISGTLDAGTGSGNAGAFIETGGLVIIEAETDFVETPGGWNLETGTPTFLVASSNNFGNANAGQTIDYDVEISTPGVYRFHMKSVFSGTSSTDENDTWFKINNTTDVHFFCVQGGALTGTAQFLSELGNPASTTKTLYYPAGNAMSRPDHGNENPGNSGYFKVYRSGGGGNAWNTNTIDNNGFPIYAYFPTAGTFTISMSERSSGHKVDRIALAHIDNVSTGVPTGTLDGAQSQQAVGGTLGASAGSPYNVEVTVADNCAPAASTVVNFDWNITATPPNGIASALIEITPGGALGASTYGGSSIQLSNTSTGNVQITSVSIDLSTSILPDNVFDPVGTGGDATASCFTPNSGATAVGLVVPTDACVDPFSVPRNGGYDVMSISFTEFDPAEQFFFTVDVDPNSIQGVPGAGGAGAVSGLELTGATITLTFSDGSTVVSSLYEDGSLGGGQAVVSANAPATPAISAVGITTSPSCVATANQTIEVSGTPGANVSLMVVDSRLYIQSGAAPFNVPDPTFYANEAMAKALYTGVVGPTGTVQIPVTLLETTGTPSGSPDGGLNYIVAVLSDGPYAVDQQVSMTSNVLVLKVDPTCAVASGELTLNATVQTRTNHSGDYAVKLYEVGSPTASYDLTATADAAGNMTLTGIAPGTYDLAVQRVGFLQRVQQITIGAGANNATMNILVAGDCNGDNFVTIADFSILATSFNKAAGDPAYDVRADFNGDGIVTIADFSALATNFNVPGESL